MEPQSPFHTLSKLLSPHFHPPYGTLSCKCGEPCARMIVQDWEKLIFLNILQQRLGVGHQLEVLTHICISTLPFPNGLSKIAQYTPNIHRYRQRGIIVLHGFVMLFAFIKAQTKFQQGLEIHDFEVNRSKAQKLGQKPTTICHIHHDSMIGHIVVVDRPTFVTHKMFRISVVQV